MSEIVTGGGVFDAATMKWLDHEWFYEDGYLDGGLSMLRPSQEAALRDWINRELFDHAVGQPNPALPARAGFFADRANLDAVP